MLGGSIRGQRGSSPLVGRGSGRMGGLYILRLLYFFVRDGFLCHTTDHTKNQERIVFEKSESF